MWAFDFLLHWKKKSMSITRIETDRFALFGNVIGVYCNKYVNTLYFRVQSSLVLTAGGLCSYRGGLKDHNIWVRGPGSVVGIATAYRLDGQGIESRWGRDFPHLSRPALRPTQPPVQWVPGLFWGVRCGRGVTLTPQPLLVPRLKIE
jgi:hypothetical protein